MNELLMVYFNSDAKSSELINGDRLQQLWAEPSGFFWIDITNPDITVLNELLSSLEISCIWTDHFDSPEILPHLHDTPAAISFYLYDIEHVESLGDTSKDIQEFSHKPLLLMIGTRFIITYHESEIGLIDYIKKDYEENFKLAGKTPGFIAFLLFQHSLYNYSRLNLMNDNFLDELEFGIMTGDFSKNIHRISTAGYNILTLKKLNSNLHIILLMLVSKKNYTISEEARDSFAEMLTETISIRDAIDSSRYLLDSIIAGIDADASKKTSEIIRVLTITSVIFMPLTLITGIFGMNFHNLPGLESEHGFLYSMLAMGFIIIGFLGILWHVGWLGPTQRNK